MAHVAPYIPERFDTAVETYTVNRLRYAPQLLDWLLRETATDATSRVLDLGCGPGFIGNALAPHVAEVYGLDPSPAMIDAARAAAPGNATYLVGSSYDLSAVPAPLRLVAMGRSFHWMDRYATVEALDALVSPGGALALLGDRAVETAANAWYRAANAVARSFSVIDESGRHRHSKDYARHDEVLTQTAFSDVREISVFAWHSWSFEGYVGYVLSRSGSTAEKLGAARGEMEVALREALAPFGPGPWRALHQHYALIARRP